MTQLNIPKCPSCGADLHAAGDGTTRCPYCLKDVVVSGSAASTSGSQQNLITLARAAADAGNDEEASALWTRVLEQDPKNAEAWLGKAKAVPMTIGAMLAGYAQAESYCEKARGCAADGDGGTYVVLSGLLDVMTHAAQDHFDEFMEIEGAGGEFLERVFFILDARERLAGPENNPVEFQAAVEFCDKLLAHPIIGRLPDLSRELRERRARYLAKGGPVLAQVREQEEADRRKARGPLRLARLAVAGIALVLGVIAIVGFGRWPGRTGSTAPTMASFAAPPARSTAPSPPASTEVAQPQTAASGTIDSAHDCVACATQEDFDLAVRNHTKCCPATVCTQDAQCPKGRVCCRIPGGQLCADAARCTAVNRVSSHPSAAPALRSKCGGPVPKCQPPTLLVCNCDAPPCAWTCEEVNLH